ncbi:hypothetical protein CDD81_6097 [Ophiocordyceps australis]|uniref:isoleucine--tRNA ligase n=1 Tax=Ophiocordyceps australis TaxID=1399860 RepID=A0A2C5Y6R1_9HYPO|nr:hypothetical protein CDD81_6097 [Ophiocordyceps australis]
MWKSTLKLPRSLIPVRQHPSDWPRLILQSSGIYERQRRENFKESFSIQDGPPYANGPLHTGHALNKILKDMIVRFQIQSGKVVSYRPGWDCHGLPIELKALGSKGPAGLSSRQIRQRASELAKQQMEAQMNQFKSFAVAADWENAWATTQHRYQLRQLELLKAMVASGLVYRKHKPIYWSPVSGSALAESELEYNDHHISQAVFIRYPIEASSCGALAELANCKDKLFAVIWTTTPWTLPANKAIAVHQDLEYSVLRVGQDAYLVASSCIPIISRHLPEFTVEVASIPGSHLLGLEYHNKMREEGAPPQKIIHADFVSSESGTGMVHLAPGHGQDDYEVCSRLGMDAFAPIDDKSCYTKEAYPRKPELLTSAPSVIEGGAMAVLSILKQDVLAEHAHQHRYPYDWRTKTPVIVRATAQWFADVSSIKEASLMALENVRFVPEAGKSRLESFIKSRSEWCISRQRPWGVPIPALYDSEGNAIMTPETMQHIINVMQQRSVDAWFSGKEFDAAWIPPALQGKSYSRGTDTLDVWFDSGCSWLEANEVADVYLEGSDQHRGWFQSSLLTYVAWQRAAGKQDSDIVAPFKTLITHGFVLDDKGKKMSKSAGNVINPEDVMHGMLVTRSKYKEGKVIEQPGMEKLGPDALRLWVASCDYASDVTLGHAPMRPIQQNLIKYRNVLRMLIGSLQEPSGEVPFTKLDQIALIQLSDAMEKVVQAFNDYEIHKASKHISIWVGRDLSAFYLEALKDRLYCGDGNSALHYILVGFLRMLAPITPLLVEEIWCHRPLWMKNDSYWQHPADKVYLDPVISKRHLFTIDPDQLRNESRILIAIHYVVKQLLEQGRSKGMFGSSLQCRVVIEVDDDETLSMVKTYQDEMADMYVVSGVEINTEIEKDAPWTFSSPLTLHGVAEPKGVVHVLPPRGSKCQRCWRYVAESKEEICARCADVVKRQQGAAVGMGESRGKGLG